MGRFRTRVVLPVTWRVSLHRAPFPASHVPSQPRASIADCGLRCPQDVSVIGFDDIASAAYHVPRLTTVRQPLRRMGEVGVQILLKRIENPAEPYPDTVMFQPELIVRESTGPAPRSGRLAAGKQSRANR